MREMKYLGIGLTMVKQIVQRAKMKKKGLKTICTSYEEEALSMYLAADGNGVLIYPEDQ